MWSLYRLQSSCDNFFRFNNLIFIRRVCHALWDNFFHQNVFHWSLAKFNARTSSAKHALVTGLDLMTDTISGDLYSFESGLEPVCTEMQADAGGGVESREQPTGRSDPPRFFRRTLNLSFRFGGKSNR